jgi:hypothetical protein
MASQSGECAVRLLSLTSIDFLLLTDVRKVRVQMGLLYCSKSLLELSGALRRRLSVPQSSSVREMSSASSRREIRRRFGNLQTLRQTTILRSESDRRRRHRSGTGNRCNCFGRRLPRVFRCQRRKHLFDAKGRRQRAQVSERCHTRVDVSECKSRSRYNFPHCMFVGQSDGS